MFKFIKNRRGFTLVELMMVIAIIGILASVLVPKIGGLKDDARAAGVDSNVRVIQAQAVALIDKYEDNEATDLETRLVSKLDDLENPVTGEVGVERVGGVNDKSLDGAAAIYIDEANNDPWKANTTFAGCVGISVYVTSNELTVRLTPFDADGYPANGSDVVTITK